MYYKNYTIIWTVEYTTYSYFTRVAREQSYNNYCGKFPRTVRHQWPENIQQVYAAKTSWRGRQWEMWRGSIHGTFFRELNTRTSWRDAVCRNFCKQPVQAVSTSLLKQESWESSQPDKPGVPNITPTVCFLVALTFKSHSSCVVRSDF